MDYNVQKLDKELRDNGIPIHGCDVNGKIHFKDEATEEQRLQAETIKNNHDSTWYVDQRLSEYPPIGEQLDMMYHDMMNGTTTWKDKITEIKNKYPKD